MTACQTLLKIILFGGASDGAILDLENDKEKIIIGVNTYTDSFFMDKDGHSVFYCSSGPGFMKKNTIEKLFEGESIF